ncbi:MAG TPA: transcriptional regulator [Dokdonella sp.]|uniref:transcriptional regulator n=1 Tax=Dokdonella sp. TaxID=2291710 RepID=UPI002BE3A22E|nr:transcriptional regulator [Dokdonella sp.]HUD42116.1 transcriptional regulator [Dokdonella sp.]
MRKLLYRFDRFELDPRQRQLRRDGQLVALPLKSFECLAYLVEHRDRAVGRDELIAAVWGSVDINDHTLAQTLSRVRQALREHGVDPAAIRTVPRFGYSWTLPTQRVDVDDPSMAGAALEPTAAPSAQSVSQTGAASFPAAAVSVERDRRRARLFIVALVAAGIGASVLWWASGGVNGPAGGVAARHAAAGPPSDASVFLVVPVTLDHGDQESAWIRLGVMDYIAASLRAGSELSVLPSDQVVALAPADAFQAKPEQIARLMAKTGATHLIQPHGYTAGGTWHFVLNLFHGGGQRSYAGEGAAPLQAVGQAVRKLTADMRIPDAGILEPSSLDEVVQRIDADLLAGRLDQAQALIDEASVRNEDHALLRLRSGQVALRRGLPDVARERLEPLAKSDSAVAPALRAEAWMGLGALALQRTDFAAGERAFSEALDLLGTDGDRRLRGNAYVSRGAAFALRRRFDQAMDDFGRAGIELDRAGDRIGIAKLDSNIAFTELLRGRLEPALRAQDRAIDTLTAFGLSDQLVPALNNKIYIQLAMIDLPGASQTSARAMELVSNVDNAVAKARIAAARARVMLASGQLAEAERLIDRFDGESAPKPGDSEFAALRIDVLIQRGRYAEAADQALQSINRLGSGSDYAAQALFGWTCVLGVDAALRSARFELAQRLADRLAQSPSSERDIGRPYFDHYVAAELAHARGESGAFDRYAAALAEAERMSDQELAVAVSVAWLKSLLDAGRIDAADQVAGRLRIWADRSYRAARAMQAYYLASGQQPMAEQMRVAVQRLAGERDTALPL